MESKAFLKSINVTITGSWVFLRPSKIVLRMWIWWTQPLPGRNPVWLPITIGSTWSLIRLNRILLWPLDAIDRRDIGIKPRSPFLGRGTMTLVVHWLGDLRLLYTSAQKPWKLMDNINHCVATILKCFSRNGTVKSSSFVDLHLTYG